MSMRTAVMDKKRFSINLSGRVSDYHGQNATLIYTICPSLPTSRTKLLTNTSEKSLPLLKHKKSPPN
ncbi:hypothetical protein GH754_06955 [Salinibacillus xinjiangensis]|uniref:Uncharacterized protein n=1 Tax=Salinibacillus xinjiangensis TaxID=1229268 RepID=A0A6G1X581_9BACI|nr:hypothetical protein [Salinibacillus xinjiangensis]